MYVYCMQYVATATVKMEEFYFSRADDAGVNSWQAMYIQMDEWYLTIMQYVQYWDQISVYLNSSVTYVQYKKVQLLKTSIYLAEQC